MILKTFVSGMLDNNNYLLIDEISKEAILIDCSEFIPEISEALNEYRANLSYVLLTHGHFDHITGLKKLHEAYPKTKILAPIDDKDLINEVSTFVDRFIGGLGDIEVPPITKYIDENEVIKIGDKTVQIIKTSGHTKGGVCYFIDDKLFSGDTIFLGSVGRTDLPGGNYNEIKKSVTNILNMFDENIKIFTGHGPVTSVGYEKKNNPVY